MTGRHHDEDGDGVADQGLTDPFADRQRAAYAGADADGSTVDDGGLAALYESGALREVTVGPVIEVDEHEAAGWDAERSSPKSVQEARDALGARVADPSAPDTLADAYDAL